MKTIIKSAALVFALSLLSTGVFAANTTKTDTTATNEVSAYVSYDNNVVGVDVSIEHATEGESTVLIYDAQGNLLLSDKFTNDAATIKKSYMLDEISDGDYVIKVITNETAVQKLISLSADTSDFAFAM
jgi:hypothetical protein